MRTASDTQESPDARAATEHARAVVEASGSSFYWAMRLLPQDRREAMYAIYAFCREVDDIADDDRPAAEKRADLAAWRQEIDALCDGRPSRPTSQALLVPLRRYDLPRSEFLAMLDGMEMDAAEDIVAPSLEELLLYCRRVAGAVGLLSIHVFGDRGPAAQRLAIAEGEALQLTNILRDLGEDARRGRLYLPRDYLEAAGIPIGSPSEILDNPAIIQVCRKLGDLAEARFQEARGLLKDCDRQALKPAIVMLEAYHKLLRRLRQSDWQDPWTRVSLARLDKLWLGLRYGLF